MKKIFVTTILLLLVFAPTIYALVVSDRMMITLPIETCINYGLKESFLNSTIDKIMEQKGIFSEEYHEELYLLGSEDPNAFIWEARRVGIYFYDESCCEYTLDEQSCLEEFEEINRQTAERQKEYESHRKIRNIVLALIWIGVLLLPLSSILFLIFRKKIIKTNKTVRTILTVISIIIITIFALIAFIIIKKILTPVNYAF